LDIGQLGAVAPDRQERRDRPDRRRGRGGARGGALAVGGGGAALFDNIRFHRSRRTLPEVDLRLPASR